MPTQPIPVQLQGEGPFETPAVEMFSSLLIAEGELPVRVVLILEDGRELRVPMHDEAIRRLHDTLHQVLGDKS